jgi:hypothetical protein
MFLIFHFSKKYGVIIQNGAHTIKIHIWPVDIMTMESTPVVPDAYHDRTVQHLQDVGRLAPTHGAHPPPVAPYPLEDPPPEP